MSLNIKIQDGRHLPISFCSVLIQKPILLAEFHSFSAIYVYFLVSFLVFWRVWTSKFKMVIDGHRWTYWKCTSKENGPRNWCNTTLPIKCFTQSPFLKSFCILTSLNVEIQEGRPLPIPLFSDLSHPIHCSCWISHHKLVSSNTCCFYMVLFHIFPQGSPIKVEITKFFK